MQRGIMVRNTLLFVMVSMVIAISSFWAGQQFADSRLQHRLEISQIDVEFWHTVSMDWKANALQWHKMSEANAGALDAVLDAQGVRENLRTANQLVADNNLVIECVGTRLEQQLQEWAKQEERDDVK